MKKKIFQKFGNALLTALVLAGILLGSCEQIGGPSESRNMVNGSWLNQPTALDSWTEVQDYADDGGGGGHCVYGAGVFLSANWNDGSLGYSTNGTTWQLVPNTDTTFNNIWIKHLAYLGGKFWAVGQGGHVATSPDGLTWTAGTAPLTADAYGIAYNGTNTYMVVTDRLTLSDPPQIALAVSNGTTYTWTKGSIPQGLASKIDSVAYIGGSFLIVCNDGYMAYTDDATYTSWVGPFQIKGPLGTNTNNFKMVAAGTVDEGEEDPLHVVVAVSRYGLAYAYADDLDTWYWEDIYPSSYGKIWLNCVLFDSKNKIFVVAGQQGAIAYSDPKSLQTWVMDPTFSWLGGVFKPGTFVNGIAFNPARLGLYLATGGDSTPLAAWATDVVPPKKTTATVSATP
jgi:hypothetical protein